MKTSDKFCSEIFEFKGLWGVDSKCGLRLFEHRSDMVVVVSELYLENPGSSITQASCLLVKQICSKYNLDPNKIIYIEHNPDMHSKLSFYDEEFFQVFFDFENGEFSNPRYKELDGKSIRNLFECE